MELSAGLAAPFEQAMGRLAAIEGWPEIVARDRRVQESIDKVLICSEYAADILSRSPQLLDELITTERLHRPLEAGELDPLFLLETPDNEAEPQFMRR